MRNYQTKTVDDIVSQDLKVWIFRRLNDEITGKLFKRCVCWNDVQEIVARMYERLMSRPVDRVFPHGLPKSKDQWMAFLYKDSEFSFMNYFRQGWRHPTDSLDAVLKDCDGCGNEDGLCGVDLLGEDCSEWLNAKEEFFRSVESRYELKYILVTVRLLSKRLKPHVRRVVEDYFLREATVEELSRWYGMTPNAIYANCFRFRKMLAESGLHVLQCVEAAA